MDTLGQDVRFALRTLQKSPVFAAAAVLSLAIGVGANTTVFTLLNAVLLAPLPFERPSELVAVYTTDRASSGGMGGLLSMSQPNLRDFRERNSALAGMAGYSLPQPVSLGAGGDPQPAYAELVTGEYFALLGVRPGHGRLFGPDEDRTPGAHPIAVASHGFWQRRLGGSTSIIGGDVLVNGAPFTLVGVAPEGFRGVNSLFSPDLWIPSMMYAQVLPTATRGFFEERRALLFYVAGRLKPGVTRREAEAHLQTIAAALEREYPGPNRGRSVTVRPLSQAMLFPTLRDAFVLGGLVLTVIVGLVLLVACANVAGLLMARAASRRQEIAVRIALGATRRRLVRQLLTESVLLALLAGAAGLAVALIARDAIWAMRPAMLADNLVDLPLDRRVLAFTAAISAVTGLLFGLLPALQASRPDVVDALKEETRSAGPTRRRLAITNVLVIAQVALSVVALAAAGLFVRSGQRAGDIDPGFAVDRLALIGVSPGQGGYGAARSRQFYERVLARAQELPGVESAAWTSVVPLTRFTLRTILREGDDPESQTGRQLAVVTVAGPGYFSTAGIDLVGGRDFTPQDREGSLPVAVVNDTLAERLWPGEPAVGKRFRFFTDAAHHQVVGVARTVKYQALGEDPRPAVYIPLDQNVGDTMVLLLRSADPPAALGAAERAIREIDRAVPIVTPFTMRGVLAQSLWPARLAAALLGVLGALALALAAVGLYGVLAYAVEQRAHEIGVRIALGATRARVVRMVMGRAVVLIGLGLVTGLAGALAVSRLVRRLLFGVSASDPTTFLSVSLLLVAVALLAAYAPARRASRLDALAVIR
jgi:predicted permease